MASLIFPEFDAYADAIPGVDGQMRMAGRAVHAWALDSLDLGAVIVLHGRDGAPVLYQGVNHPDSFGAYFSLPGTETRLNGGDLTDSTFGWFPPGGEIYGHTRLPARFIAMDLHAPFVRSHAGADERVHKALGRSAVLPTERTAVAALMQLATRAFAAQQRDPQLFDAAPAREALGLQVLHAVFDCLALTAGPFAGTRRGRPGFPRQQLIRRSIEYIEACLQGQRQPSDLPLAVGTSARSLHRAFGEAFGVSPQQYYRLARLHAIRDQLRAAHQGDTVTAICARFGVWDFGRLASVYRRLFGLLPSQELARAGGLATAEDLRSRMPR